MQHIKNIIVFTSFCLLTGCSNDFLDENLTPDTLPMGLSNIYISPGWESSDYAFMLPSVQEADYEIASKPSWLKIDSRDGHLSDYTAVVECSATKNPDFDAVGIYMDFMTVKADGKDFKVPVAYITEGNPTIQAQSTMTLSYSTDGRTSLPVQNTGSGILIWEIISIPDWLVLDTGRLGSSGIFIPPYSTYDIPFLQNPGEVISGSLTGTVVLSTNDKEHPIVTINVTADLGTPHLLINTNAVNFSFTETSKPFTFGNTGNGRLVWEFTGIPEWLTITPSSGMYGPYSYGDNIIFSCDRTKLSPGQNSATVILNTNDSSQPSYSIRVMANAPGNTENIRAVDGNITDAVFNKNTNTLYYVTSSPNRFVAYDVTGRTVLNEISLSKAPTSFAISEDWGRAAVGHNGYMSAIDLSANTVTAVYTLNYSVNDITWAENDWYCFTQVGTNFTCLHWINMADGTIYDDPDGYSLDGNSIIKKVPGQPYLIATRNGTSPSGFFAYDIATKSKKSYSHMDLTNFWFSEDGDYIFAMNSNIYRTTSSTGSTDTFDADISAIGKINTGAQNYYGLQYVYHNNNYLWVLQNDTYPYGSSTSIYQVEDNDYTPVKKYDYDLFYYPDAQATPLDIAANFVFANKEGTEIAVLCKSVSGNSWVIQFVTVQ